MPAAEPFWRRLEAGGALATPYQRFDLLAAWQLPCRRARGCDALSSSSASTPRASRSSSGRSVATTWARCRSQFLGSKHANFNVGLWRRDIVAAIGAGDLRDIFDRVATSGLASTSLALFSQPLSWDGLANPFPLLPYQAAVDDGARHHRSAGRRDDRRRADLLDARAPAHQGTQAARRWRAIRYFRRPPPPTSIVCSTRSSCEGDPHGGARPDQRVRRAGVAEFLREACHRRLPDGRPLIEIHALEGGGESAGAVRRASTTIAARRCSTPTRSATIRGIAPA